MTEKKQQNLILFSVDHEILYSNYEKTVQTPVPLRKLEKIEEFSKSKLTHEVSIWGITPTKENEQIWNEIRSGDIALFYRNEKYFAKAIIRGKIKNEKISSLLWTGDVFGRSMNLLVLCENVEFVDIDFNSTVPIFVEPTMPQAYFFPIKIVNSKKMNILIRSFGTINNALIFLDESYRNSNSRDNVIESLKINDNIKFELKLQFSKQRHGQDKFRNNVLLNYGKQCAVCEINDVNLLEASHIIPVVKQNSAGLMRNGICLCVLHHTMFDKGYFSFDDKYQIMISNQKEITSHVRNLIHNGDKIRTPKIFPSKEFLMIHRSKFGIK